MPRYYSISDLQRRMQHLALVGGWCLLTVVANVSTALSQDRPPMSIDTLQQQAIIEMVVSELNACYIDLDVAAEIERKLRAESKAGRYARYRELAPFLRKLREDIRLVTPDPHLGVWPIWFAPSPVDTSADAMYEWREKQRRDHFGFRRVEVLPGNVGYNETIDLWTPGHVQGSPLVDVPVYVLQSEKSASAAEHLIYARENRTRVTQTRSDSSTLSPDM